MNRSTDTMHAQPVNSADMVIVGAGYGGPHGAQRLTSLLKSVHRAEGLPWPVLMDDRELLSALPS